MKTIFTVITTAMIFCAIFESPLASFAQAGSLDLNFGTNGIVTTAIGVQNVGYSIAIQSDGKILVAGSYDNNVYDEFVLCRYNTNGSLDNTFDFDGKVTTNIGNSAASGFSVAVQSDYKILVAGVSYSGGDGDFALVRYNNDGSLDNTFDADGKVTTSIGAFDDVGYSVAIQSDGKIFVAGYSSNGSYNDFALIRYNNDGSLDTTFDMDGKVTTSIGINNHGYSLAIQNDGKIVVAGVGTISTGFPFFALVRYNINGSIDSTFDTDGKVTTMFGAGGSYGLSVAIQSDGKILVSGYSNNGGLGSNNDFALARYNTNGGLDSTFDLDGIVTTSIMSNNSARSLTIQSDAKIVAAGSCYNGSSYDFALARYNQNGSLDSTFDTDGKVTTNIGGTFDVGHSVAIQTDGKIVVAGSGYNMKFAVVRYNNDNINAIIDESCIQYQLVQIYPNPFSTSTTIQSENVFNDVSCIIHNMYGQKVRQIDHLFGQIFTLKRDNLPSGVYLVQLTQDNKTISRSKIILTD